MNRFESWRRSLAVLISYVLFAGCGFSAPPSNIFFTPERLDFGDVSSCATVKRNLTIRSQRRDALTIEVPSHEGFIVTPSGPQELGAFGSVDFEVAFTGDEAARDIATQLTVLWVDRGGLERINVAARIPGQAREEANVDFLGVSIRGSSDVSRTFDEVTFEPSPVAAFTTTSVTAFEHTLRFAPTTIGPQATTLVGRREGRCPLHVNLRGDGVDNVIDLEPSYGNFTGRVGQPSTQTATFRNLGRPVNLTNIQVRAQGQSTPSPEFTSVTEFTIPSATRSPSGELQPSTADSVLTLTPTVAGSRQYLWTSQTDLVELPTMSIPLRAVIDP